MGGGGMYFFRSVMVYCDECGVLFLFLMILCIFYFF